MPSAMKVHNVVEDFGANPTGTTNSSVAFQNAIDAAQADTSAPVYIPGGQYIADGMNITAPIAGIIGGGRGVATIRCSAPSATMFSVTNTFLVRIKSLSLCGVGGVVQSGGSLVSAVGSHAGDYSDLQLVDCYQGIVLDNSTNCRVSFCKGFQPYGPNMVYIANGGGAHVESNQFDNSSYGPTPYVYGASVTVRAANTYYAAGSIAISNNCYFIAGNSGTTGGPGDGPSIAAFGAPCRDGSVFWYFMCASNFHQISLGYGANSNYVRFNDCDGPSAGGIAMDWSCTNMVFGNTISNGFRSAIDLNIGSSDNKIIGNLVQNMPYQGIAENDPNASGNIVAFNTVANIGYTKIQSNGSNSITTLNVLK